MAHGYFEFIAKPPRGGADMLTKPEDIGAWVPLHEPA
jgi:hypothetical protein